MAAKFKGGLSMNERPAIFTSLSTVIFPSIDRAGRSVKDVIEIDQALQGVGVTTVFLREGVDTSTPTGQLFRNIMASIAEFEGKVICERLHNGRRRKAAMGGVCRRVDTVWVSKRWGWRTRLQSCGRRDGSWNCGLEGSREDASVDYGPAE